MGLYDYDLYLFRTYSSQAVLPKVFDAGLLRRVNNEDAVLQEQVNCIYSEGVNSARSDLPLTVIKLFFNNSHFEQFISQNWQSFLDWFWQVVHITQVEYAFMMGSFDGVEQRGESLQQQTFAQIPNVYDKGDIKVIHPFMYFSKRIINSRLKHPSTRIPEYTYYEKTDLGVVLALLAKDLQTNNIEIVEFGPSYKHLLNQFLQLSRDKS
jgi:hypothetical protein